MPGDALALELRGITKRFGALVANDAIDFELRRGEIHALLGENGAGKSTLMNVLYGLHQPDEGEIRLDGEPVRIDSARRAIGLGIGMVHQHFMLVPVMTVAENLVLGTEPHRGPLLDFKSAAARTRELSERFGLAVDPDARVEDLGVGAQQRVEILRALFRGAKVLVLDEPTAVLTAQESQDLFRVLRALKEEGTSIVFISHKLNEVLDVSDRVTVLRRGKKIDTVPTEGATERSLARLMVGRDVLLEVERTEHTAGRAAARGQGPARQRRSRAARGARAVARGAGGRDRRPRRRRRQRPEPAGRGDRRAAQGGVRHDHRRRAGHHRPRIADRDRGGRRPHRRGPPRARARPAVRPRREPLAARVPQPGDVALGSAVAAPAGRAGAQAADATTTSAAASARPRPPRCRAATSRRS